MKVYVLFHSNAHRSHVARFQKGEWVYTEPLPSEIAERSVHSVHATYASAWKVIEKETEAFYDNLSSGVDGSISLDYEIVERELVGN